MKSHMSKSEHIRRKASAPSLKARARVQPLRVCLLRATHSHAHAHVHVHGHVRAHTWAYLQWVSVAGGVGGLLLRRPMIEQGAVSTCVRALMCRVQAVARTLRRKSPHANSSRPGDATRAPGRQRMRGCSSGRSSARRRRPRRDCCRPAARVEVLDAHAERAARARARGARRHDKRQSR